MKIRGITRKAGGEYRTYFFCGKLLAIHFNAIYGSGYSQWMDLPPLIQAQIEKVIYIFDGQ